MTPQQALTRRKNRFFTRLTKDRRLRGLDFPVAWNILDRVGVNSPVAWPSEKTIANDLGCCEKSVSRSVNAIIKCGWFENERRGRGEGVPNRYRPLWDNRTDLSRSRVENGTSKSREQDKPVSDNRTNLSHESSQEPYLESIGSSRVPPPLKGGAAPLRASPGDTSLEAGSDGLHGLAATYIPRENDGFDAVSTHILALDGLKAAGFGDKEAWGFLLENYPTEAMAA